MDFDPGPTARVRAERIGFVFVDQNRGPLGLAFGKKAEVGRVRNDPVFGPGHRFGQGAGMNGCGDTVFGAKVDDQHRHLDRGEALGGQRLDDPRVDDNGKADAWIAQVLRTAAAAEASPEVLPAWLGSTTTKPAVARRSAIQPN